jgi:hypothetical protein
VDHQTQLSDALAERDDILINMDVDRAKDFVKRHGGTVHHNLNWERVLHLARYEVKTIPHELHQDSHIYLARNGAQSVMDLNPNSQYARCVLHLIFPFNLTEESIKTMGV